MTAQRTFVEVMTADEIATLHEAIEWQRQKREAAPTPPARPGDTRTPTNDGGQQ